MFFFIKIGLCGIVVRFRIMEGYIGNDDKIRLKVDFKLIREKNLYIFQIQFLKMMSLEVVGNNMISYNLLCVECFYGFYLKILIVILNILLLVMVILGNVFIIIVFQNVFMFLCLLFKFFF